MISRAKTLFVAASTPASTTRGAAWDDMCPSIPDTRASHVDAGKRFIEKFTRMALAIDIVRECPYIGTKARTQFVDATWSSRDSQDTSCDRKTAAAFSRTLLLLSCVSAMLTSSRTPHTSQKTNLNMFALSASQLASAAKTRVAAPRARNARHCRRAAATVRATATESPNDSYVEYPFEGDSCELNDQAAAIARGARIDPADGSIAEAAPLGNDNSMFSDALVAFKVGPGRYCPTRVFESSRFFTLWVHRIFI
jgi:hypothetical protein